MAQSLCKNLFALCCALPLLAGAADAPPAAEKIARGLLLQHAGKMIFSPCRERAYVQVEDLSPGQMLSAALVRFGLAENKPLYVEFFGTAEADRLKVTWINFAHRDARCQASAGPDEKWRALGAMPAWNLHLGELGLKLEEAGQPEFRSETVNIASSPESVRISVGQNAPEHWQFTRQLCSGPDQAALFGWQAELQRPGRSLRGCAWQGY